MMGRIEVTKVLVEQGANVNATNNYGSTPYDYAVQEGKEWVAKYLKSDGDVKESILMFLENREIPFERLKYEPEKKLLRMPYDTLMIVQTNDRLMQVNFCVL